MRPIEFLTIPQAARLLGRGSAAVRRAVQRGDLPACRVPGCQARIPASAVASLLEGSGSAAPLRFGPSADQTPVRLAEPVEAA